MTSKNNKEIIHKRSEQHLTKIYFNHLHTGLKNRSFLLIDCGEKKLCIYSNKIVPASWKVIKV